MQMNSHMDDMHNQIMSSFGNAMNDMFRNDPFENDPFFKDPGFSGLARGPDMFAQADKRMKDMRKEMERGMNFELKGSVGKGQFIK